LNTLTLKNIGAKGSKKNSKLGTNDSYQDRFFGLFVSLEVGLDLQHGQWRHDGQGFAFQA